MFEHRVRSLGGALSALTVVAAVASCALPSCAKGVEGAVGPDVTGGTLPIGGGPATGGGGGPASGGGFIIPNGGAGAVEATGGVPPMECPADQTACTVQCPADQPACTEIQCFDLQTHPEHCGDCVIKCSGAEACEAGACVCNGELCGGSEANPGTCRDTMSDPNNCGACFALCAPGEDCVGGVCSCEEGFTRCGALCVDTNTSTAHCGGCDAACASDQLCSLGTCAEDCDPPFTRCDLPTGAIVCADLLVSAEHCGACNLPCPANSSCLESVCYCDDPYVPCGSSCVDLAADAAHCGGCDLACGPGQECASSTCFCTDTALTTCGTDCVDTETSDAHCGACDNACSSGAECIAGVCECLTSAIQCLDADGLPYCTDPLVDNTHCGVCDNNCAADAVCTDGTCICDDAELTNCDGVCYDLTSTNAYCGSCSNACPSGELCVNGQCEPSDLIVRTDAPTTGEQNLSVFIDVCNQSSSSEPLTGITLKYWYSRDGTSQLAQAAIVDYSEIAPEGDMTVLAVDPAVAGTNSVAEVPLESSLGAGACARVQLRIYPSNFAGVYDAENDWSYMPGTSTVNDHVTLHQGTNVIWGIEPTDDV